MFCSKCGKNIPDQAKFCLECGTPVLRAEDKAPGITDPVGPAKKPKKKALLIAIPIAMVVVAIPLFLLLRPAFSRGDAAVTELLGYIDQTETLTDKMISDYNSVESAEDKVLIMNTYLADLADIRKKADAISGIEDKLQHEKTTYFNLRNNSGTAWLQSCDFWVQYDDFHTNVVEKRPLEVDYDSPQEYSDALNAWGQEARSGYAAVSCPEFLESEWKQYVEILDYNESIAKKMSLAVEYDDRLRYYSAKYMTSRYLTVERTLSNKINDRLWGDGQSISNQQILIADAIADEIHAYAEMNHKERDAYQFNVYDTGIVFPDYDVVDTIYPSLYNTYDAFVIVKTGCIDGNQTIVVEMEIPGFTQKYRESFQLDTSYKTIYIKPPALTGQLDLSSAKDAQINITISEQNGALIDTTTFPVTLKSKYDFEWYTADYGISTQDNILCFLTPEATAIAELQRQAIDEIAALTANRIQSFIGYQSVSDWDHYSITYVQAAGLMKGLYDMGVRYLYNPFSISGSGQRIRLPEDVIAQQGGLCIETSLTIASALQSAGMHAFLLFPPGHAQVAVEIWNSGEGRGEYLLIETTALTEESNTHEAYYNNVSHIYDGDYENYTITYFDSEGWEEYLKKEEVDYIIDCDDSRLLGLTPFAN